MTNLFRRGGSAGRGGTGGGNAVVCPSCGLRNDPSARFCRNCGLPLGWPEDPVRGTTSRRADLPSERGAGVASIIGLLVALAVLVAAGYLVLHGSGSGGTPGPSGSPRPSSIALGSPGISPLPSGSQVVTPSTGPLLTPPPATPTPTETATQPPSTPGTATGFTCNAATIMNPATGQWRVTHVTWRTSGAVDTVIVDLAHTLSGSHNATITVESMTPDSVNTRYGLMAPRHSDQAVVVTFVRRVSGFQQSPVSTGMIVVRNVEMGQGSDQLWHLVLGQTGNGCHRIGVDAWATDPTASTAQLLIDVKK